VEASSCVPAKICILDDITVRVQLCEAPQRTPKTWFCTDLGQVQQTLYAVEQFLEKLRSVARRVEDDGHLLNNELTTDEMECLAGIKRDIDSYTMTGLDRGLHRLI
jgi:hypothetical protein